MSEETQPQTQHVSTGPVEIPQDLMQLMTVLANEVYRKAAYLGEKNKLPFRMLHQVLGAALMVSVLKMCEQLTPDQYSMIADEAFLGPLQALSINGVKPSDRITWRLQ